jgi:hypothetical protein
MQREPPVNFNGTVATVDQVTETIFAFENWVCMTAVGQVTVKGFLL